MSSIDAKKKTQSLSFAVRGLPAPSGSRRIMPIRRADGSKTYRLLGDRRSSDWIATVRTAASNAMQKRPLWKGPVLAKLLFTFPRPKKHYRSGNKDNPLREDAPKYVARRPDIDKLTRAVLDALTGSVFLDDSQVVKLEAVKTYSNTQTPGVKIRLTEGLEKC